MKHNWEYIKLGAGCVPKKQIKRATKHFKTDDLIEYIDISSIDRLAHRISSTNSYIFAEAPSRAQQCVENNDVLVSLVRPNLKNVAIINDDRNNLIASSGFCILRGKTLIPKFVYYIATSSFFTEKLVSKCAGAAYPAVNEEDVRNILIPQPYKDTQEKIVNELDKINEIISDCKKAIRNLDSLAQSLFYDFFGDPITNPKGWKTLPFDECIYKIKYPIKLQTKDYRDVGLYPIISQEETLISGYTDLEECVYYVKRPVLIFGDHTRIVKYVPFSFALGADGVKILNPVDSIQVKYFYFCLLLFKIPSLGYSRHYRLLKKKEIPVPPMALQVKFAARIEQIEQQKKYLEDTIANMQTLLNSRMDYWFN